MRSCSFSRQSLLEASREVRCFAEQTSSSTWYVLASATGRAFLPTCAVHIRVLSCHDNIIPAQMSEALQGSATRRSCLHVDMSLIILKHGPATTSELLSAAPFATVAQLSGHFHPCVGRTMLHISLWSEIVVGINIHGNLRGFIGWIYFPPSSPLSASASRFLVQVGWLFLQCGPCSCLKLDASGLTPNSPALRCLSCRRSVSCVLGLLSSKRLCATR